MKAHNIKTENYVLKGLNLQNKTVDDSLFKVPKTVFQKQNKPL